MTPGLPHRSSNERWRSASGSFTALSFLYSTWSLKKSDEVVVFTYRPLCEEWWDISLFSNPTHRIKHFSDWILCFAPKFCSQSVGLWLSGHLDSSFEWMNDHFSKSFHKLVGIVNTPSSETRHRGAWAAAAAQTKTSPTQNRANPKFLPTLSLQMALFPDTIFIVSRVGGDGNRWCLRCQMCLSSATPSSSNSSWESAAGLLAGTCPPFRPPKPDPAPPALVFWEVKPGFPRFHSL